MSSKQVSIFLGTVAVMCSIGLASAAASDPRASCHLGMLIDEQVLIEMAQAPNSKELRATWEKQVFHDLVQRVMYQTRLLELEPCEKNELALLETIPGSTVEFWYLYAINDTRAWQSSKEVPRVYFEYFNSLARAAAKHPQYIRSFLLLRRLAGGGEASYYIDGAIKLMRERNQTGYLSGLKSLDRASQRFICDECPELRGVDQSDRNK